MLLFLDFAHFYSALVDSDRNLEISFSEEELQVFTVQIEREKIFVVHIDIKVRVQYFLKVDVQHKFAIPGILPGQIKSESWSRCVIVLG